MTLPRGVRNHNPLNLREGPRDKTVWMGERATEDDPQFEEFEFPEAGFRAGAKTLLNYQRLHGLKTPRAILNRFAPPNGRDGNGKPYTQNTEAYVRALCTALGVDGDDDVDLSDFNVMFTALKAMTRHEQGAAPPGWEGRNDGNWYSDAVIRRGIEMVGLKAIVPPPSQSPTARAATAGGVLGTGLALNEAITLADKASGYAAMDPVLLLRLGAIVVVVGICVYIVTRRVKHSKES